MKYLRVNWESSIKEGYFIQVGESLEDCEKSAYEVSEYESIKIKSFQLATEDDYEKYLEGRHLSWFK